MLEKIAAPRYPMPTPNAEALWTEHRLPDGNDIISTKQHYTRMKWAWYPGGTYCAVPGRLSDLG